MEIHHPRLVLLLAHVPDVGLGRDPRHLAVAPRHERREIIAVHLRKRRRRAEDFDLDPLVRASEGYVGAELEQAVIDAMYVAFGADREFATDDILAALRRQVPLSVSQRETVQMLRNWLHEGRAQLASLAVRGDSWQGEVPLEGR